MTPWSVEMCKGFPQWVWLEKSCSHRDWKVLLLPKEILSMRNMSDAAFYTLPVWLTCWNWYFLGWWILFCKVIHHSGIGKRFCIFPSSLPGGDPKQLIVLRNIFERGLNEKNFLILAEWSISKSTGSPSHGLGLCTFWLATTILKPP